MTRTSNDITQETTMTFKRQLMAAAVAGAMCFAGGVIAANEKVTESDEARIKAEYKAAKEHCDDLKSNAKDVCVLEAKGVRNVAKAELKVRDEDSPKNRYKLQMARAEADYDVAKEKCDDLSGNAKDVCVKDAKAAFAAAKAEATAQREVGKAQPDTHEDVSQSRGETAETARMANYAAAKERCDGYSGDAKDSCVSNAKSKYGVN
jgi:hypothetical protein